MKIKIRQHLDKYNFYDIRCPSEMRDEEKENFWENITDSLPKDPIDDIIEFEIMVQKVKPRVRKLK